MSHQDHSPAIHPEEIRLNPEKNQLTVSFPDASYTLSAEMLRVTSPSAEVQGHSPSERVTVGGKRDVTITRIEPVGNYAVKLIFSDGHSTGIYSWHYLRKLGTERDEIWQQYLNELSEKGLRRDK
ncbi:MAG: gamma-butyrobetaine hydroxylase-like domain-containing protein [Dichotomicrobium sp.]